MPRSTIAGCNGCNLWLQRGTPSHASYAPLTHFIVIIAFKSSCDRHFYMNTWLRLGRRALQLADSQPVREVNRFPFAHPFALSGLSSLCRCFPSHCSSTGPVEKRCVPKRATVIPPRGRLLASLARSPSFSLPALSRFRNISSASAVVYQILTSSNIP